MCAVVSRKHITVLHSGLLLLSCIVACFFGIIDGFHYDTGPEAEVDDALQLLMQQAVAHTHCPSHTLVLLSGDGNNNYGKGTFPECAERALQQGWRVEVWAWKGSTNKRYRRLQIKFPTQFSLVWLDTHRGEITYRHP